MVLLRLVLGCCALLIVVVFVVVVFVVILSPGGGILGPAEFRIVKVGETCSWLS